MEGLSIEIQHLLCSLLDNNKQDIKECILACKSWKCLFERHLYSRVEFKTFPRLRNFVSTLKRKQHLRQLVKDVTIGFESHHENCLQRATITKLLTLTPNLERIDCSKGLYYAPLLEAILANQLPKLNHVVGPIYAIEHRDFVDCCLLLKDRMKHIDILKADIGDIDDEDEDDNKSLDDIEQALDAFKARKFFGPSTRLLADLNQFKNLAGATVEGEWSEIISLMDYVLDQSPSLRALHLKCVSNNDSTFSISDVSDRVHNLSKLTISGQGINDSQIVDYILHSFPKLEELSVTVGPRLDVAACTKLLDYLPKVKIGLVEIPWGEQAIVDTIGLFWKAISQEHSLTVNFKDPARSRKSANNKSMTVKVENGKCSTIIYSTEHERYPETIEKYGRYMNSVVLLGLKPSLLCQSPDSRDSQQGAVDPEELRRMLRQRPLQEFLDHDPKHKVLGDNLLLDNFDQWSKLKKLKFEFMGLANLTFPYRDSTKSTDIESLSLVECYLQRDGFKFLSSLYSNIKIFELSTVVDTQKNDPEKKKMYSNIRMMETNIDTLLISKNSSYRGKSITKLKEERVVLVSIQSQNVETCYYYDFRNSSDNKFKPMGVEYFVKCRKFSPDTFIIDIRCKSLKTLIVKHKGKDLRLDINSVQ